MLILIAGATGGMGQKLAEVALDRGHFVRGLGRTSGKMPEQLLARLESFVTFANYDDVPALDKACKYVDAVMCAYPVEPRMQLEGQLLLLRAAERTGIKKFVADSWNADYRWLSLGDHECFDPYICFRNQIKMTTDIKPIFLMTGAFAESLFGGAQTITTTDMPGLQWLAADGRVLSWGTGDEQISCVTMHDAAAYTIRILERPDAEAGGDYRVTSFTHTLKEMIQIYREVTGSQLQLEIQGSIDELREKAEAGRAQGSKQSYWPYVGYFFALFVLDGTFEKARDSRNHEFAEMARQRLSDWFALQCK